jgi:hypothetical protein
MKNEHEHGHGHGQGHEHGQGQGHGHKYSIVISLLGQSKNRCMEPILVLCPRKTALQPDSIPYVY